LANRGFRNPRLVIGIWATVTIVGWFAVGWGIVEMQRLDQETAATGISIGVGFPVALIATGMLFLAMKGARIVKDVQSGATEIARWTVSPEDFADFLVNNAARDAHGGAYANDWKPPRAIPPEGLEIVFSPDGVLVGDTYFGLVTTGLFKFEGVQMLPENPLAIEFGTVETTVTNATTVHINRSRGVLRLPVSRLARAEAIRVLDHYKRVDARETIVNPGFYRGRMRFGLYPAPVCFLVAAIGFGLQAAGYGNLLDGTLAVSLAVGGVVAGIGALVLVLLAWSLSRAQHTKRR
jgi:hypothetical protein